MPRCNLLMFAALLSLPAAADVVVEREGHVTTASSGEIVLRFLDADGGLCLSGATLGGLETIRKPSLLWGAEFRDTMGARVLLHSGMGTASVSAREETVTATWNDLPLRGEATCGVSVTVSLMPERRRTEWRIAFASVPDGWSLYRYRFPLLTLAAEPGESCALVEPFDWGTLTIDPLRQLEGHRRRYPRCEANMQFYGLQRGQQAVYLGCHDPRARAKEFLLGKDTSAQGLTFGVLQPTRLRFGGDYEQTYPFVLQVMDGDWYDVAQNYRDWGLTAPWTWRGPLSDGTKTPQSFLETPLVLMRLGVESFDPDFVANWAVGMQERLGVPITQHYYGWHQNFGSMSIDCYPEYFPTLPGFRDAVSKMEGAGVRVMPYFNARLWRTDRESWRELGRRAAARDCYGKRHDETWMAIPAAVMNPTSRLWQWAFTQAVLRAVDCGCSAVYLDQLGEGTVWPNYAPEHPHEPGETGAWIQGCWQMAEAIREEGRAINPALIMTMEGNAEPFIGSIDSCLTGNANSTDSIPLFSAVYHDYVMQFGRYIMHKDVALPKAALAKFAQQFIFGGQFGWSRAPLESLLDRDSAEALCLRRMAVLRHRNSGFLAAGRMLRPLDPGDSAPVLELEWYKWDDKVPVSLPQVMSSVWQRADGQIGVLLLNIGDEAIEVGFGLSSDDYPVSQVTEGTVYEVADDGSVSQRAVTVSDDGWQITAPPLSPLLLVVDGKPTPRHEPPGRPELDLIGYPEATSVAAVALPFTPPEAAMVEADSRRFPFCYEGDELPGGDHVWSLLGSVGGAGSEQARVSDGSLHIDTLSSPAGPSVFLTARQGVAWDIDPVQGYTVEARLRVTECNDDERFAFWLLTDSDSTLFHLQLYPDKIVPLRCPPLATDLASRMRTIRLVGMPGGETANVYLDGELIVDGAKVIRGPTARAQLVVGPGASAGRVRGEVDYVRFDPSAALTPR